MTALHFLGLENNAEIPDAISLGNFEERLRQAGLIERLFEKGINQGTGLLAGDIV
jgi:IS5 family transposase